MTQGYGAGGASGNAPAESWATGTDSAVGSHYLRLLAQNPAIAGKGFNDSVSGTNMSATYNQATIALGQGAEYVTIWSGTNDVCTPTTAGMTTTSSFAASLHLTLQNLSAAPGIRIMVLSIPDLPGFWQQYHSNGAATSAWAAYPNRCPDLFGAGATPRIERRSLSASTI